jgi:2-polyprenyl-6-methoxyphenol hydroxylase-like FAD-dependent oxidoreductase
MRHQRDQRRRGGRADGVGSAVRRKLVPHATLEDVGLRCIYGRMTIDETTDALIPASLNHFSWVADQNGCGAGFAPVRFRSRPEGASDYLMTTLVATTERLGIPDEELFKLPPERLWKLSLEATTDWHPAVRELYAHADAIHTMPPTAGVGANTALQDAATLAGELGFRRTRRAVADRRGRGVRARHAPTRLRRRRQLAPDGRAAVRQRLLMLRRRCHDDLGDQTGRYLLNPAVNPLRSWRRPIA